MEGCLGIAFVGRVGAVLCLCWQWRGCLCVLLMTGEVWEVSCSVDSE